MSLQFAADRGVVGAMSKRRVFPLLLVAVVAFLLAGASLPHTHAVSNPGIWNAEHDLMLMAAFGTHACQLEAMPVLGTILVLAAAISLLPTRVADAPLRLSASRAPPRF
jgi:hypothetical protein